MEAINNITFRAELVRKGIHLFALVIPLGYTFLPYYIAIPITAAAAVISIIIDISRFRDWFLWRVLSGLLSPIIRDHEFDGGFTGASYILTTSTLSMILFPKAIAVAAMIFVIIGDTAAAVIGRVWGRHRLVGRKSWEGSLACLVSLCLVSFLIPGLPAMVGLIGAVVATLAEALSGKLDDNFTVQMASGLVMLVIMYLLGYQNARLFEVFLS